MEAFETQQTDEGYSEDPLNPSVLSQSEFLAKPRNDAVWELASQRSGPEFPEWLTRHIGGLSVADKTQLAMAILGDLPTSVISQIVEQLNPRLYIDFIRYLPPEVCLKILGYLDPLSLLNLARSCRGWYDLALDRKLWERLYYNEGWQVKTAEIERWERLVNERNVSGSGQLPRTMRSQNGHAMKKQAFAISPGMETDLDYPMVDFEAPLLQEPVAMEEGETSIFGGGPLEQMSAAPASTGLSYPMLDLQMEASGSSNKGKGVDRRKGKGKATTPESIREESMPEMVSSSYGIPKQTLWMWDGPDNKYKVNWKYLYTMRRRLESNWELGKYTNFQLPHPDYPDEGHRECIYSLQYNSQYLVSGSRDRTIRKWDLATRRLVGDPLVGHGGSVLCLQFDSDPAEDIIVSGSSDSDVMLWRFSTGEILQRLRDAHRESVLNVRFDKRILVTCSKDKTIKIFNRRPLRYGDLGYKTPDGYVDPVPRTVRDHGFGSPYDDLPVIQPYTMIGVLEGHSAAVNAVQIHGREVVSASGDRQVKVWDWPTETPSRTIVGHNKGIACVQYDGRRIVSGSSDNEVKIFDRQTGLEVASLRSHINLVRTVQAGFADLPNSVEEDEAAAKKVDEDYFKAVEAGQLEVASMVTRNSRRRLGNAGSRRPEDITAYGAKLPPGGGGGKYGRIVSGSYDTTIIIWRRDKEGIWKDQHHLKQEDAATAAALRRERSPAVHDGVDSESANATVAMSMSAMSTSTQQPGRPSRNAGPSTIGAQTWSALPHGLLHAQSPSSAPPPSTSGGRPSTPPNNTAEMTVVESPIHAITTPTSIEEFRRLIDNAVPRGPRELALMLASYPTILTQRSYLQTAIDREPSPFVRSQLRQAVNTALVRTQFDQARQRREAIRNFERQLDTPEAASEAAAGAGEGSSSNTTREEHRPQQQQQRAARRAHEHGAEQQQGAQRVADLQGRVEGLRHAMGMGGMTRQQMSLPVTSRGDHLHQVPQFRTSLPDYPHQHQHNTASLSSSSSSSQPAPGSAAVVDEHHHTSSAALGEAFVSQSQSPPPNTNPPQDLPPAPTYNPGRAHHRHRRPHNVPAVDAANPARVFKLQFDAHRIICCSQTSTIVGWDFCNDDPELIEAARFFAPVQ